MNKEILYMKDQFEEYHIDLSEEQLLLFYKFYEMLIEKNKVMNLTGITEFQEVVEKHFIDSVLLSEVYDCKKKVKIIDIGTGAGFPGIPLKIAFPDLEIVLMDSLNKRIKFLDEVIQELDLKNICTVHARAEELARKPEYREGFDLCVSRAVANLATLEEYCLPFVGIGGQFISYKSGDVENEVTESKKACSILGGKVEKIYPFTLIKSESKRTFVVINKTKKTPKAYPRKAGTPSKEPLK